MSLAPRSAAAPHSHELVSVATPKQARSRETLYRLLDAAEALIDEKGLADASVPEIARRAGSSIGGFYARFKDKNELLRALEERFFLQVTEILETLAEPTQWGRASLSEIVEASLAELVRTVSERARLIAAFMVRATSDPDFREDALRFRQRVAARISDLLLTRRDEIAHPEPEVAIDLAVQLAFGFMLQHVLHGESRAAGRALSEPQLVQELSRSVIGYLVLERDPASSPSNAPRNGERSSS